MDYRRVTIERVDSDTYDVSAYIPSNKVGEDGVEQHLWTEQVEEVQVGTVNVTLPAGTEIEVVARTGFMSLDLDRDIRKAGSGELILDIDPGLE
jgi:hypothetical protein